MAAILSSRQTFFTGSYTGRRIDQKDSHEHFPHFELLIDAVIQILTEIYQFQNLTYLTWLGDVMNDVMNMYSYNCSHNLMIYMHRKFNDDDIFARCLAIMKNVIISFIKEYRGPTLRPACDVIDDVITMKNFFGHNLGRSYNIWGQIEAVFNISKFSKWPLFWARDKLFYRKLYRNWIDQKDSHEHFRHFELLIDAVAQILTEIYHFQNLTYFVTWWRHRWRHECVKHNLHN